MQRYCYMFNYIRKSRPLFYLILWLEGIGLPLRAAWRGVLMYKKEQLSLPQCLTHCNINKKLHSALYSHTEKIYITENAFLSGLIYESNTS